MGADFIFGSGNGVIGWFVGNSMRGEHAFANGAAYVKDRFVRLSDATVPMLDRGFVRSDATYDVAHVWNRRFFRLDDHVERFLASVAGLRMHLDRSASEIRDLLVRLVAMTDLRDAYVQMTCTRGTPPVGSRDPRACENQFSAFVQPFVWLANDEQRRDGLCMVVSETQRIPPEAVDPRIKNFHWLDLTRGIFEAYDRGATVAIHPDRDGYATEGAGFNVFVSRSGALATPRRGVFEGMTRKTVLELSRGLGIRCDLVDLPMSDVRAADEIFITSTAGGIMPVTVLDGVQVGDGPPGPVTKRIRDAYWKLHDDGTHMLDIDRTAPSGGADPV